MNLEQYQMLNKFDEHLRNSFSSFVRISTKEFSEIEHAWELVTGQKEVFNHSCGKCNLNFLRKVATAYLAFQKTLVDKEPEPEPVSDSVSETNNITKPKKATNNERTKPKNNRKH